MTWLTGRGRKSGKAVVRQGHLRKIPGQRRKDGPPDHAGHGTHGKSADGNGTGRQGMGTETDAPAGIGSAAAIKKKGGIKSEKPLLLQPNDSEAHWAAGDADGQNQTRLGHQQKRKAGHV